MKATTLLDGIDVNVIKTEMMIDRPVIEDGTYIFCKNMRTLKDGTQILECLWDDFETEVSFYEFDVYMDDAQTRSAEDIIRYLISIGFYLEDIETEISGFKTLWKYSGFKRHDDMIRVTYYDKDTL